MKHPEHDIQSAAIAQYRMRGASNAVLWAIPNGGARDQVTGALMKKEGVEPGAPDLFAGAGGNAFFVEVKADKGKLSDAQKSMHRRIEAYAGLEVVVTYGLDQLIAILERKGVLRANRAFVGGA
jgi:elongation factor P hydroxylase